MRSESGLASDAAPLLRPAWDDLPGVVAGMSTRAGGVSRPPFDTLNLHAGPPPGAVADDPVAVEENQRRFARALGAPPVWLSQVHGAEVVRLTALDLQRGAPRHRADASVTTEPGLACCVQVADCLPVLMCAPFGRAIGAAHAGWRGLAAGVLGRCLNSVCELAACPPEDVRVWLGACIGPAAFEVGADVLEAFGVEPLAGVAAPGFVPRAPVSHDAPARWWADLPGLARRQLAAAGAIQISGGGFCTVSDRSRFFSFRRDRLTGRMAAGIARLA